MSSKETPTRRRNRRGEGQLLREQFISAAAHLLATLERPETLTLRQVARAVGASPASIYRHFPNLDALVQHVLRRRFEELEAHLERAAAGVAGEPLPDLVARCAAYVHWGVEHPAEYRTIIGGGVPAELAPLSAQGAGEVLLTTIVELLSSVRDFGGPADPEAPWRAGLLLWTGLHGLVSLYNEHGQMGWPDLERLIGETIALHSGQPSARIGALLARSDQETAEKPPEGLGLGGAPGT